MLGLTLNSFGTPTYVTLKVGETYSFTCNKIMVNNNLDHLITGNAIAAEFGSYAGSGYALKIKVTAVTPGYASFTGSYLNECWIFHVVGVTDINIPNNLGLKIGDSYTYAPIITDAEATPTLTWTSSNTSVVTVDQTGLVTAISEGQAIITCRESGGASALSSITVNPVLINNLSLSEHKYEILISEKIQLAATIYPANATSKAVKWISTNENIAQVDDAGNVTALAPGYCSIFCIADDGSKKYDKCLVHVQGESASRADVNGDGKVSVTDAFSVIDVILNQ